MRIFRMLMVLAACSSLFLGAAVVRAEIWDGLPDLGSDDGDPHGPWSSKLDGKLGQFNLTIDGVPQDLPQTPCLIVLDSYDTCASCGFLPELIVAVGRQGGGGPMKQKIFPDPRGAEYGWFYDWGFSLAVDRDTKVRRGKGAELDARLRQEGRACTTSDGVSHYDAVTDRHLMISEDGNTVELAMDYFCAGRLDRSLRARCEFRLKVL